MIREHEARSVRYHAITARPVVCSADLCLIGLQAEFDSRRGTVREDERERESLRLRRRRGRESLRLRRRRGLRERERDLSWAGRTYCPRALCFMTLYIL